MRRRVTRAPVVLALASILASFLLVIAPGTASAAESIPELQWPAIKSSRYIWETITSPSGVTNGCTDDNGVYISLKTINNSGQVVRELNPNEIIDGRQNCISHPVIDKKGYLYGYQGGGNNLLAYSGNTLKWKYPTHCWVTPTIGADGNIYAISTTNGIRLIGLTPNVESGASQPRKVLDIPYSTCSGELVALKDGIAIIKESGVAFYSYSGRSFGELKNIVILRQQQLNAMGRVFYQTYTGTGNTASVKVSAYDAFSKNTAWTASDSIFGQGVTDSSVYSIPNGGAVVLVQRAKTVGGTPTTEKIHTLIQLNALGHKTWEKELPSKDTNGNRYDSPRIIVDTNGRNYRRQSRRAKDQRSL